MKENEKAEEELVENNSSDELETNSECFKGFRSKVFPSKGFCLDSSYKDCKKFWMKVFKFLNNK